MSFVANPDYWIERAVDASGVPSRGLETLAQGLRVFLAEYARSTQPTAFGRECAASFIVNCLAARFRIEDWIVKHPEVLDQQIVKPVFILGMPRAGTTTLVNMLAHDPARQFYWNWEANREIPPATDVHNDPRVARKVQEINAALEMGMLDHRQHVEMGDQPAEEAMLLGQDFKSILWWCQAQLPGYFEWALKDADWTEAYAHHKRTLQVLHSAAPGKWTLKMPSHAMAIDAILKIYPDARIVVTHRDPTKTVASGCDAERFFLALWNQNLDLPALGREYKILLRTEMEMLYRAKQNHPQAAFYDFHYQRFIGDPLGEIRRIYAFLGDEFTPEVEAAMRRELGSVRQIREKAGAHHYSLETFGLTRNEILDHFESYIARYGVQMEGA